LYKDFEWAKFIIADEAHYLKSVDSQRTELFFNLFNKYPPQYFLALTGTPIKNRIPEIYTLLVLMGMEKSRTLKIQKDFRSYYMFCHNFTNPRTVKYGQKSVTKFEGHKNIDQLKLYLKDCYIRRKAEDVLNLPEVVEEFIKVEYGESEKELREAWEAYSTGKVIANSTVKRDTALAKSRFTSDYLSGLLEVEERNIVVFSHHPAAAERIHDAIKGKTKSYLITGSTEVSARHKYAEEFAKEVGSVLVATIDSFSTGVNLVSANHLVFNDLSWVPSDNDQALKRIHRIGQTKTCFIHYIVGGSVDDSISRMLSRKSNVIKRLI
jgi:SNF2 family DNA or RNA helicase